MKQNSLFTKLIIAFASVILITSCTRTASSPQTEFAQGQTHFPKVLNLVADNWSQLNPDQPVYTSGFNDIMHYGDGSSSVKIYMVTDEVETLISSVSVLYMGGYVYATHDFTDITLHFTYEVGKPLPFERMNIRVVFE